MISSQCAAWVSPAWSAKCWGTSSGCWGEFGALGIRVSFANFSMGQVSFTNTPSRVEELQQSLGSLLVDRKASAKFIERLRGRMLYAGGQLFGRLAKLCVQALRSCEVSGGLVSDEAAEAISLYLDLLVKGPPRLVTRVTAHPMYSSLTLLMKGSQARRGVVWRECFWTYMGSP